MIILVDVDDTIWKLADTWIQEVNKLYGTSYSESDIISWDMTVNFPDLTEEQVFVPVASKEIWDNVKPVEDSIFYLRKLQEEGHVIYLVTASTVENLHYKQEAILKMFPFIDKKHIIFCCNKQLIKGDYLVDDNPANLIGGEYTPILFNRAHNAKYKGNVKRCYNWKEVYEYITNGK